MTGGELPEDVRRLIQDSIPTLEALEIVLLLARDPGRDWQARALPPLLHPGVVTEQSVAEYLRVLAEQGLVTMRGDSFVYQPRSPDLQRAVEGLILAYHQRPVTLIRTLYAGADRKQIRSFAEAFRLRKER